MATFRKLASGNWQARIWHPGQRRYIPVGQPHPLKRVVKERAAEEERKIRRGEWIDPALGEITLADWWDRWSEMRVVERSTALKDVSRWRNHVAPAFGSWSLCDLGSEDVEAWVAEMRRNKVGGETVAASLRLLKHLLDKAVTHKRLLSNPAADVTAPAPPKHDDRFLSVRESKILRLQFTGADRLMVDVLLGTGLRWEELAGLHVYRLDIRGQVIRVREVLNRDGTIKAYPKSVSGWRSVPLTEALARRLADHVDGKADGDLVFTGGSGGVLHYNNWRSRIWMPAVRRAELVDPQPTIHDLRHTWCSWLAERGVPLTELKELSGHARLSSLERYLHASETKLDRARQLLQTWHTVGTPRLRAVDGGQADGAPRQRKTRPDLREGQSG